MDDMWHLSPRFWATVHVAKLPVAFLRATMAETAIVLLITKMASARARFLLVWTLVDFFMSRTHTPPLLGLLVHMIGLQGGAIVLGTLSNPLETFVALGYVFLYFFYILMFLVAIRDITH